MLMVVAEIVKSHQGSSRSSQKAKYTTVDKNTTAALKPVAFMTYIALGLICLSATSYANTIVVDKNADKTQRPIIMPTANGATQVNITAPSGAGVSHNKFTQFDVSEKGVILNNSHKASQTELAGYIKGNDLLLKSGSAKVILNEINSKHASQLNGYIEVAGQKAQVVIANAAGITCNGCGFINANRATLTTGKPILENGELKGYLVEQGNIAINGKGLNSAKQDYTDLIAQTVNINASLWANDVKVVAGRNNVNQDVSQITKLTDNDQASPQLAIDVAALGGMYAGKIQLVGTQTGVGVHNSGQLGASAGNITITADGKIVNTGSIQAKGDITLTSQQDITNSKQLYSQKNIKITSQKQINNQATIVAQNDITLNANTIVSDSTSTIAAGIDDKGQLTDSGSIYSNAADITLIGQTLATQSINLHADKTVNLNNGKMLGGNLHIIGNDINAKSTTIKTNDSVNIQADNSVNTTSSMMTSHGDITIHAKHIENDNSSWQADNNILLDADVINNRNSDLLSLGNTTQNALSLDNSGSKLRAKGDISQTADDIDNQKVIMLSERSININANNINNKHADLRAQQNISQQALIVLDNQQSKFVAGDNIQLTAKQLNQGEASLTANQLINIHAQNIDNDDATLLSKDLQIVADELSGGGKLSATGDITLTLQNDFNNNGEISANRTLSITSQKTINNNQLFIAKNMSLNSEQLNNNSQAEISADNLELKTNTLINQGLIDGGQVSITTQLLDNKPSGRIYGDNLTISANTLNNLGDGLTAPVIAARNDFKLAVGTLNNYAHGLLLSLGNFTIGQQIDSHNHVIGSADVINNHSSTIESQGDLLINSQIINNINDNIEVEDVLVDEKKVTEWSFIDSPDVRYRPDEVSEYCVGCGGKTNYRELKVNTTGKTGTKYNYYDYNQKTYETQVITTDPAKIMASGNVTLNTTNTFNDNSHINAGQNLIITGILNNNTTESIQRIVRAGIRVYRYDYYSKKGRHYNRAEQYGYNPLDEISAIDLSLSTIKDHTVVTNNVLDNSHRTSMSQTNLDKANIDVGSVSTVEPNITLPTNSLYTIHKDTEHHYLIETDSRFTNKKAWLSSDYMFKQLKADPNNIQKRLGDGYYEQQLIQQQIIGLTGQRYLADYANDLAQYQALMNSGVEFANQYGLSIGVALTDAQMNMLTSDIVWMVSKTVTIDGQDIEVLVPQVYIVNRPHVTSAGALVSGKNATIQSDSDIHSSGTIVAKDQLSISANNIHNQGNMIGGKVLIDAQDSIFSFGKIAADAQLMLNAGKDINLITNTHTEERNNYTEHDIKTVLDKVSTVNVKNGDMTIKAGHDINTAGALIVNQDKNSKTLLEAGNNINLSTVKTRDKEEFYISNKDYQRSDIEHVVGSEIYSQGNISLKANNDINVTASSVNADNALAIQANNININSESSSQLIDVHQEVVTKGTFSKTKSVFDLAIDNNVQTGSSLSGKTIDVNAKNDINVVGSNLIATDDLTINTVNNVDIKSSQDSYYQKENVTTKTSGLMSSGGLGFTIGSEKESTTKTDTQHAYQGSTIGSTEGNVSISAGKDIHVTGSDIIAKKDIDLTGDSVTIDFNDAQTTYKEEYKYEKSGLTVAITGTAAEIYDAIQAMERAKEKGNDKLLALQSIKSGLTGVQAMQDLVLKNKEGQTEASIGVSLMAGTQKTEREVNQEQHSVIGSGVSAGQNITITATGNAQKEEGDITLKGSEVRAGNDITLDANRDLNVIGAVNTQHSDSDEKSYGGAVGIQFQIGGDESGFRFKGNANFSRERENADGSAWSESVINAGNTLTTKTGNDTTIIGGQVNGDTIKMDVGNNLNIQSLQDTDNYDYDKISASVSGSGGSGFSANLALSKTDIESNWASVTDQSGIFAGKGGFDITVGNNTDLQGAVIASKAEDKTHNQLDTGTISFSDIENKADFDVSSMSMSIGTSGGPSPTAGMPTIYHNSGHDHSTTASAVEDGSLTVRNEDEQQQNINQLSRDTANANNPLAQLFNKQKELDKIEAIELVRDIAAQAKSIANKYDRIQAQNQVDKSGIDEQSVIKARDELGPDATEQQVNSLAYSYAVDKQVINNQKPDNPDNKNIGGMGSSLSKGIDAATSIVTGLITGDITGGLAGASAPYLAEQIKLATGHEDPKTGEWKTDDKAANLTAHALLGAAIAIAQGNSALAGGVGALAGEAAADFIREKLYNKDVKDLSEAEKENISALAQLAVGLAVAAGTGGNTNDVGTAVAGSKNAVENNYLANHIEKNKIKELANGNKEKEAQLLIASCALTKCSAGFPVGSKEYEYWAKIEAMGASDDYAQYRAQLEGQTGIDEYARQYMKEYGLTENELQVKLFEYGEKEALRDAQSVFNKENGIDQRVAGGIQAIGGGVEVIVGVGSCAETVGLGCVVAAVGTDNAFAGIKTVWTGNPTKTSGAALLESMGVPKEQSEIVYALMTGQVGMLGTAKANQVVTTAIKLENGDVVNVALNLEKNTLVAQSTSKVGSSSSTTSNAVKGTIGTTSNGYKVSNGADSVIAKVDLEHPIVQSRINVQNGNNKAGWNHVVDRHFSDKNASQFTISQSELKTILQSNEVSKVPISRVIDSADGLRYERVITFDKNIGVDKFSKGPTNTMTILTDEKGNLITTTPGRIK